MAFFSLCPLCSFAAPSSELKVLIGDRTQRSGGYEVRILRQHAASVTRFGWGPRFAAFLEFGRRDLEVELAFVSVDGDWVAIAHQGQRTADIRFGGNVA